MAVKVVVLVLVAEPLAATADVPDAKALCDSGVVLFGNSEENDTRITMKCALFTSQVGRRKLV